MKKPFERRYLTIIQSEFNESPQLIHAILGPRQVGKTTLIAQLQEKGLKAWSVSADGDLLKPGSWLDDQWDLALQSSTGCLIIDEIQKVENWSEVLKKRWDDQARKPIHERLRVIVSGSSSLALQRGLSDSLAGRYWLHRVHHWGFRESRDAFGLNLEDYLRFGGYPGSYPFIQTPERWLHFVRHSVIDAVLGKDILSLVRVKSPALFKQCFELACSYPAQELSYNKLLGQLQDKGNTDLVKNYLELFEWAFLLRKLFKVSGKKIVTRTSSPKLLPLCPALFSSTIHADYTDEDYGRAFELAVGAELDQLPGELGYWRDGKHEVDYVLRQGRRIYGIEVKWGKKQPRGLAEFRKAFPSAEVVFIGRDDFLAGVDYINQRLK